MDVWPLIHDERHALAADLTSIGPAQWSAQSMCAGWTIEDVLAHMVATAKTTQAKFFAHFVANGFRFNAMSAKAMAAEKGASGAATLASFEAVQDATAHPPGPVLAMLGEQVVHGEDIRRPLGISRDYPQQVLTTVADFYKSSNLLIGGKKRVAGLSLKASDMDWSSGSGPVVTGPMKSLVLVIAGRKPALDDLSGEGLTTLKNRV